VTSRVGVNAMRRGRSGAHGRRRGVARPAVGRAVDQPTTITIRLRCGTGGVRRP
jgi:hypothetical protein